MKYLFKYIFAPIYWLATRTMIAFLHIVAFLALCAWELRIITDYRKKYVVMTDFLYWEDEIEYRFQRHTGKYIKVWKGYTSVRNFYKEDICEIIDERY